MSAAAVKANKGGSTPPSRSLPALWEAIRDIRSQAWFYGDYSRKNANWTGASIERILRNAADGLFRAAMVLEGKVQDRNGDWVLPEDAGAAILDKLEWEDAPEALKGTAAWKEYREAMEAARAAQEAQAAATRAFRDAEAAANRALVKVYFSKEGKEARRALAEAESQEERA